MRLSKAITTLVDDALEVPASEILAEMEKERHRA